ncbi:MAG: hypothetical protein Q6351_007745 [Candidatus Njordarchaeum guaymaensis]
MSLSYLYRQVRAAMFLTENLRARLFNLLSEKNPRTIQKEIEQLIQITAYIKKYLETGYKESEKIILVKKKQDEFFEMLRRVEDFIRNSIVEEAMERDRR